MRTHSSPNHLPNHIPIYLRSLSLRQDAVVFCVFVVVDGHSLLKGCSNMMATLHEKFLDFLPKSLQSLSISCGALLLCYTVLIVIYRLRFHPLAKVPGPFLAKVSGFYPTISSARGRRHLDQYECHQRYGPIVRWAPDYILFDSVEAVHTIYSDSRKNNVRKSKFYK